MQLPKPRTVDIQNYSMIRTIGQGTFLISGAFGTVKLAKNKSNNQLVAIKFLKKYELIKNKQVDHVHDEVTILSNMKHPFIVTLDGYNQDECYIYLVMEFVQGGEFFIYLRSAGKLKPFDAAFYGAQVSSIFEYMHGMNIVYRDLKPENLLINSDGYLKITDFGFAKFVVNRTYTLCGTPEYIAPEILLNKGHGKPVDWWALGILIYEMNHGIDPFTADDPMQIYQNILSGKIKFSSSFDVDAKSIVRHLVEHDLSKRYGNLKNGIFMILGVDDIKKHRYFKAIDWKLLVQKQIPVTYKPKVKDQNDDSCFQKFKEETTKPMVINKNQDPFLNW